jgi:hypothetical protein
MVISPVIDGRIVALNKTDGSKVWEVQVAGPGQGEVLTGAPLLVKDMVVTGMAGAGFGVRGWIEALDHRARHFSPFLGSAGGLEGDHLLRLRPKRRLQVCAT